LLFGNSAFTFPVGKGSNYQSIRISSPSDSTDAFTAEYFDSGQTLGTATDPTFDYISSCEYFMLKRTTGTSTVSVTLAYDMSSCVTNLFPDPRVIGWDGSKWADLGQGSFTFSTFGGTIVSDGPLSAYGAITLGNNSNSIALPPDTAYIPSSFRYIKNNGQLIATNDSLRPDIKYYMNDAYPKAYLGNDTLHYVFAHIDTVAATTDTMVRVDVTYLNANSTYPVAQHVDSTYTNYFLAHCPSGVVNVPQYQRLTYGKLYQNIDLVYAQNAAGIKFAFDMRAGAKADVIRARYAGTDSVKVLVSGELRIYTLLGNLTFNAPHAFQVDSSGNTVAVSCEWYVDNDTEVIFTFPIGYNQHLPLAIVAEQGYIASPEHINSPEWSQYFGGNGYDEGTGVTTDMDGNAYFTGFTSSTNFPTSTGVQPISSGGSFDAYIAKFGSANGASLGVVTNADRKLWATYCGGTGDDRAYAISTSGNGTTGNLFITGYTESGGFPTLANGIYNQSANAGGKDAFIIKLDNAGGGANPSNVWITHFGGSGNEISKSIKNDGSSNFYIAGSTSSAIYSSDNCIVPTDNNFPKCNTFSSFNNSGTYGGGTSDAFIAKFSNAGQLLWSSFYGGGGEDVINGISIDGSNTVYFTGKTSSSSGFPLQAVSGGDVYNQGTFGGGTYDAFVSKFNSSGTHVWSTYFGGSGDDEGMGIVVDANNNLYISGETSSSTPACSSTCMCVVPASGQFPLCNAAGAYFQGTGSAGVFGGLPSDGFIAKFDSDCYLRWGTYYGGNSQDVIKSLAIDYANQLFFTGTTSSSSPTANIEYHALAGSWYYLQFGLAGTNDCMQGFFDASNARHWSSYFGAATNDISNSIAVYSTSESNKFWYTTGATNSLPVQQVSNGPDMCCPNAYTQYNQNLPSSTEAFVTRFSITGMYMLSVQNINSIENFDALVYPNPASYNITLKLTLTERENVSIDVYSITGQLLYTEKMGKQQGEITKEIDFSKFGNALYLLQIKTDTKMITKKIIKHE
jgi:hypothetical protein